MLVACMLVVQLQRIAAGFGQRAGAARGCFQPAADVSLLGVIATGGQFLPFKTGPANPVADVVRGLRSAASDAVCSQRNESHIRDLEMRSVIRSAGHF